MRWSLLLAVCVIACTGCAALEDYHYCWVNHRRASSAWKDCFPKGERRSYSKDYENGWKQGYFEVLTGGSGEPPAVPPNKYWKPSYQSVEGQNAIQDWYAGFQDGATAAQSGGTGEFHWIPTGPTVPGHEIGWHAYPMHEEGQFIPPPKSDQFLMSGLHPFLQPNERINGWPAFTQDMPTQAIVEEPEYAPVQPQEPVQPQVESQVHVDAEPPVPAEPKQVLPDPSEDVNIVPPVITED